MVIDVNTLYNGQKFRISELVRNGIPVLRGFIKELTEEQRSNIMALIKHVADNGPPINETRFAYEKDQIWAFKDDLVRVYCFYDEGKIILLTNGDIKKRQKADRGKLEMAVKLMKAYFRSKRQ